MMRTPPPLHPLQQHINTIPVTVEPLNPQALQPHPSYMFTTPLQHADVYMDDFIGLAQAPTAEQSQAAMLQGITSIFRDDHMEGDAPNRKQVISRSKLVTGDGTWSTIKPILGWGMDTANKTLKLPQHKAARLIDQINAFLSLKRTSRSKWQQLLGEFRHMAVAIPGARHLFSVLQHVLIDQPGSSRLRLSTLVKQSLTDWQLLANTLARHPTAIQSLVPNPPTFLGAVDASSAGLGGVWMPSPLAPRHATPFVFRLPFPTSVQHRLVSATNPSGDITNSDLELAALIVGAAVLQQTYPTRHSSLLCASDNASAVSWLLKGSTSSTAARAFLLRWLASLTRNSTFELSPVFAAGHTNTLADCCSRLFHLSDQDFLATIQRQFPTETGWRLVHPNKLIAYHMTSALYKEMSPWESPDHAQTLPAQLGPYGKRSATPLPSTHWDPTSPTPFQFFKYLPIATAKEKYLPVSLRSEAAQWAMPYKPLARQWPTWDSPTHV